MSDLMDLPNEIILNIITYLPVFDRNKNWFGKKILLNDLITFAKTSKQFCKMVKDYSVYLIYNNRYNLYIKDVFVILKLIHFIDNKIVLLNDIGSIGFRNNRLMQFDYNELKNHIKDYINKICYDDDDIIVSYGCYSDNLLQNDKLNNYESSIFYFGWGMRFVFEPEDEEVYEKIYISGMSKLQILDLENTLMKRDDFTKITILKPFMFGELN